jgi:hypothetical protein
MSGHKLEKGAIKDIIFIRLPTHATNKDNNRNLTNNRKEQFFSGAFLFEQPLYSL